MCQVKNKLKVKFLQKFINLSKKKNLTLQFNKNKI